MKAIHSIITLLLLAGCTSHLRQYDLEVQKHDEAMKQAIAEATIEVEKCHKGPPPSRSEYVTRVKCLNTVMEAKLIPVMLYPEPFRKMLYINLEDASLYSQGKISKEQLEARNKLAALESSKETNEIYNGTRQQLYQQDNAEMAQVGNALQGFQPSRPVYTSCSGYGNTVHCTSNR